MRSKHRCRNNGCRKSGCRNSGCRNNRCRKSGCIPSAGLHSYTVCRIHDSSANLIDFLVIWLLLSGTGYIFDTMDYAERAQTSTKASNLNQQLSGIRIRISGLIWVRLWVSEGSLLKYHGFIIPATTVISPSVVKIGW